jgi:hypothetical protein
MPTNHAGFRLDNAFHRDLSGSIHDRDRNAFLVHIHADIFGASHKGRSFLEGLSRTLKTLLQKGRHFKLRRITGKGPCANAARSLAARLASTKKSTVQLGN